MPIDNKREQIVETALNLFYQKGFHATGVDTIIKVANVSKKTLYKHFQSKEALILEVLRKRDALFIEKFVERTESMGKTDKQRLLTIFDAIDIWIHEETFSGCMFINAAAEFASMDNPCHQLCKTHKTHICQYIEKLARNEGTKQPKKLSEKLNLLIEGAIVEAYVSGKKDAAKLAKDIARGIVRQHMTNI